MQPTEADVSFLRACGISWPELEEIVATETLNRPPRKLITPGTFRPSPRQGIE